MAKRTIAELRASLESVVAEHEAKLAIYFIARLRTGDLQLDKLDEPLRDILAVLNDALSSARTQPEERAIRRARAKAKREAEPAKKRGKDEGGKSTPKPRKKAAAKDTPPPSPPPAATLDEKTGKDRIDASMNLDPKSL